MKLVKLDLKKSRWVSAHSPRYFYSQLKLAAETAKQRNFRVISENPTGTGS